MSRPASASAPEFPVIDGIAAVPDAPVFHRRPLHEVGSIGAPRFGDDFWDLTPAMHLRHRKVTVNWLAFPAEFREPMKLYTFALINVTNRSPRLVAANSGFPSLPTIKHDLQTGERTVFDHGVGRSAGEPVFVARRDRRRRTTAG